jgi:uncharacterized protein YjbI with pentapeptide repeats
MRWPRWLGVGERRWRKSEGEEVQPAKTLWDWLQLLIVPAILVAITLAWSRQQTAADNKREDARIKADRVTAEQAREDATLQSYLDRMGDLMLKNGLLTSKPGSSVRAVASAETLTALRRLNGERKAEVVRFLHDSKLINAATDENPKATARVSLHDADLRGARFRYTNLFGANLASTDLHGADLRHADLIGANLQSADLRGAHLSDADLESAWLAYADLQGADLARAYLLSATLEGADLKDARLNHASLKQADLDSVTARNADLEHADLGQASLRFSDLRGAQLDGADLSDATLDSDDLDLGRFIAQLPARRRKLFLVSQEKFLDALTPAQLRRYHLSAAELARFRRLAARG